MTEMRTPFLPLSGAISASSRWRDAGSRSDLPDSNNAPEASASLSVCVCCAGWVGRLACAAFQAAASARVTPEGSG